TQFKTPALQGIHRRFQFFGTDMPGGAGDPNGISGFQIRRNSKWVIILTRQDIFSGSPAKGKKGNEGTAQQGRKKMFALHQLKLTDDNGIELVFLQAERRAVPRYFKL